MMVLPKIEPRVAFLALRNSKFDKMEGSYAAQKSGHYLLVDDYDKSLNWQVVPETQFQTKLTKK